MRKITRKVTKAFLEGRSFSSGNTMTDGDLIYLHGKRKFLRFVTGDDDLVVSIDYEDDLLPNKNKKGKKFSFAKDSNDLTSDWERLNYINSEDIGQ